MAEDWWSNSLHPDLSQGDIVTNVPLGTVTTPPKYLYSAALKGNAAGWGETLDWRPDHNGIGHYLYRGRLAAAMVLSHDCDIDKPKGTHRVVVAVAIPRSALSAAEQNIVFTQQARHSLPLPDVPEMGDYYADFRSTLYLPFTLVSQATRIASMSDAGRHRLQAQLIGFYTRLDISSLVT